MLASGFSPAVPSMSDSTIAKNVIPASCGGRIFGAALSGFSRCCGASILESIAIVGDLIQSRKFSGSCLVLMSPLFLPDQCGDRP
jgi:hypothetical protein